MENEVSRGRLAHAAAKASTAGATRKLRRNGATTPERSCVPLRVWSWSRPRCRTERHSWRLPPATARLPTHGRSCGLPGLAQKPQFAHTFALWLPRVRLGHSSRRRRAPATHLAGAPPIDPTDWRSIKADPMTVLQPHETGSCALISVQDGQRRVRHLLAASRGCPPRTHAAAASGCIGRLWVPQDYSSRGRALERRRYTCADVARVKWLLVQGRRQLVGLSVVSACSREYSTVCDSHGCSWVGHGAGGLSGAPQQPPWL